MTHVEEYAAKKTMYYSCQFINDFFMVFNSRVDNGENCLTICCESIEDFPAEALGKTGKETVEHFIEMRSRLISEGKTSNTPRVFSKGCVNCSNYRFDEWKHDDLVHYVNLSMYPAPCQCKCSYCSVPICDIKALNKTEVMEGYEIVFDALEYAQNIGLIAPDATWQVSSGEIAIHPLKNRILDIVKNKRVAFYTNCFKFEEEIAKILSENPFSGINISIDSCTPNTWFKVKGVDNFEKVTDNLVKYYSACSRTDQIRLKYIILPGVNNNYGDYELVIKMMKTLGIVFLEISRDGNFKYKLSTEQRDELVESAGYLIAMLTRNNLFCSLAPYTPEETANVVSFAKKLLESGAVCQIN